MQGFDQRAFRDALGAFATGVTVVTTSDTNGEAFALTVNSFTSVSLDPPLVLWCVNRAHGHIYDVFAGASHYAVHVLRRDQEELSRQCIVKNGGRMPAGAHETGIAGLPLFAEYCARFQCRVENRYEGGDHLILVGRVLDIDQRSVPPLIFHASKYRALV
jgi:3-hydroxy-9,10-secoandrosta-1,3,5(10)-triene-9,17-dione monooxygenase reductase component